MTKRPRSEGDDDEGCCPDPCRPRIIEVSTVGFDPDREGIGAGPSQANVVSSRLFIPPEPTPDSAHRYSFILCGINVPRGATYSLLGFAQKLVIGIPIHETIIAPITPVAELPVTTYDWAFPDGNVAWSIRWIPGARKRPKLKPPLGFNPANAGPSKVTNPYGVSSALLYQDVPLFVGYTPPNGGQFYGNAVEGLGTFYDMRNPWGDFSQTLDIPFEGPGDLIMVASVWQTNIETRPNPSPHGQVPEDVFMRTAAGESGLPPVVYRHIAGRMMLRLP